MASFHLLQSNAIDYDAIERRAAEGEGPRYGIPMLARRLAATLHQAEREISAVALFDRVRARLCGTPQSWSLARSLAPRLGRGDVVYCLDAEMGLPMAASLRRGPGRPKLAVFLHNLDRPRGRLASEILRIADTVDLFIAFCSSQLEFIRDRLKVAEDRTFLLLAHIDDKFYSPGPQTAGKERSLVSAIGLERRDYVTFAEATRDLNVDVRIDSWSAFARKNRKIFPREMPANMTLCSSKPRELVQLYRDTDVLVVPMFPNKYAGITSLLEGLACQRPIVASRTVGLSDYLSPPDGITPVEPCNPAAIRAAIVSLIDHPEQARTQGRQGYESVARRYNFERHIETLASRLEAL
jgi:glycosyltransferase involved in cell wall biosynthesis